MSRANPFFRRPMYSNPFVGSDYYGNKKRSDLAAATAAAASAAAIKIQKACRGFLVRKNLRIAREIEAVVDEIEMKFMREQEMDLIVRDEKKERLRINEMLMRLDLVRGVRDNRKRVVRRVIALQEMVDSISAGRSAERTLETASEESLETKPDDVVEEVKPLGDNYRFGAPPPEPTIPKVVSIPVHSIHFVGSDDDNKKRTNWAAAAASIKIQKAFRGFLVRKKVRIAPEIEAVVDEIEMKFMRKQEMDLIVRDEKERLRINEMLMRLLFRLDLVPRVRDYRKRVIQRVIALQEMVDSISAGRSAEQTLETMSEESLERKPDSVLEEVKTLEDEYQVIEMAESKPIEESKTLETANQVDSMEMHQEVEAKTLESGDQQISAGCELLQAKEVGDAEAENQESLMEEGSIPGSTVGSLAQEVEKERSIDVATPAAEPRKNQEQGVKDMMERVVAENEKLKGLVALLCERSAQQCRLMGGLAQRVEHLEKIVEKMERKKKTKRKDSSSTAANFC